MRASPEAIYLTLFLQRGARCARELIGHLRRVKILRRPLAAGRANRGQGQIIDAVSNSRAAGRARGSRGPWPPGGDLIAGSSNTYIATLVARSSRFLASTARTPTVSCPRSPANAILPGEPCRSLTWDRGMELASHRRAVGRPATVTADPLATIAARPPAGCATTSLRRSAEPNRQGGGYESRPCVEAVAGCIRLVEQRGSGARSASRHSWPRSASRCASSTRTRPLPRAARVIRPTRRTVLSERA